MPETQDPSHVHSISSHVGGLSHSQCLDAYGIHSSSCHCPSQQHYTYRFQMGHASDIPTRLQSALLDLYGFNPIEKVLTGEMFGRLRADIAPLGLILVNVTRTLKSPTEQVG